MKKLCGLILAIAMLFAVTSSAFATADVHPLSTISPPIIYIEK